jgi:hypothetical protein
MADDRTILLKVELDTSALEKKAKDAATEITNLKTQQKALRDEGKQDSVEYKKLQVEITKYNKELTNSVKAIQAAEVRQVANTGSLVEMREELANAKLVYAQFNKEQRESAEGQEFVTAMLELKNGINDVEQSFGTFTGSVGNYEEAIKNALGEQYLLDKSFEDIATSSDTLESKFEQLNEKISITPKTLNGLNAQMEAYKAIALQAGEAGDEVVRQQALERAAALRDMYADLEREVNNLANDQKNLQGVMEIGQTAIASYGLYQSALAAVGIEGEEFEEMLIKLQAAQTALSSLQQISVVIQKQSAAAQLIQAQASRVQAAAMAISNKLFAEGSIAAKTFSKALIATGIGALIAGVGLLIANFDKLKAMVSSTSEEQAILNEHLDDYKSGAAEAILKTNQVEAAFALAKKGVISKDEALQTYNETLGDSFGEMTNLNDAEATFVKKKDAFIKATAQRALATALFAKAAEEQANAITAGLEDQVGVVDKSLIGLKILYGDQVEAMNDVKKAQAEGVKAAQNDATKRYKLLLDEGMKQLELAETTENANGITSESESNLDDDRKKRADDQKKRQEEALKLAEEIANRMRELAIQERELTTSQERQVLEAHYQFLETIAEDNTDALLDLQAKKNVDLRALELKELDQSKAAVEEKYRVELESAKGNAELIAAITKTKTAEIAAIENEANNQFVQREIEFIAKQEALDAERLANEKTVTEEIKILSLELALEKVKGSEMEFQAWQNLQDERIAQLQRYRDAELAIETKSATDKEKVEKSTALQIEQIQNESFAAEKAQNEKSLQDKVNLGTSIVTNAKQFADILFEITSNRLQKELSAITETYNADSTLLQEQLDANLISQADFIAQKSALDAEFKAKESKLKTEQWEKERTASLISAGIATALAVAQALPNIPLSVLAASLGLAQIGIIASAETPTFARGGKAKEGVFGGNLHSNGGTKGVFSDGTKIEVEKDEAFFILNRRASSTIAALSNHNVANGGVPFANGGTVKFADGGAFASSQSLAVTQRFNDQNAIVDIVRSLPVPVVDVVQAVDAIGNNAKVVNSATY